MQATSTSAVTFLLLHYRLIFKNLHRQQRSAMARTFHEPICQVARLIKRLAEYDSDFSYCPGKQDATAYVLF